MTLLEQKIQNDGLFFTFKKAFVISFAIACSLKLLESQFVTIPNLVESLLFDFFRSCILITVSWGVLDRTIKSISRLPEKLSSFLQRVYLSRVEDFDFKQYSIRLLISIVLSLPVYLIIFYLLRNVELLNQYDFFEFTLKRSITFYFLFMPFLMTVADLKTQLTIGKFINDERLEREVLLREKDAQLLKAKLKPHFLFNTLNSIAALIRISPKKAEDLVEHLSDFFRQTLLSSDKEFIRLKEEIDIIKNLIHVEKERFGDRLQFQLDVDESLNEVLIPSLLFQPFVENSIKHGVEKSINPVQIKLSISIENHMFKCIVADTGKGCDVTTISFGYGLKTSIERLQHYYGDNASYSIHSEADNGFDVIIYLPIREHL